MRHDEGSSHLLQRNVQRLHNSQASTTQQGSEGIQFRFSNGLQDDQKIRRRCALRESLRRYAILFEAKNIEIIFIANLTLKTSVKNIRALTF